MDSLLYIGFLTLESWLSNTDPTQPVFANLTREVGKPGPYGQRTDQLVILTAQARENIVYYARFIVAKLDYMNEEPVTADHKFRIQLAESAWRIVHRWLEQHLFIVTPGVIAMPANLILIEASASFIRFNPTTQAYEEVT